MGSLHKDRGDFGEDCQNDRRNFCGKLGAGAGSQEGEQAYGRDGQGEPQERGERPKVALGGEAVSGRAKQMIKTAGN